MNILNKVTLKTLRKNKVRTIVTIIGIILSAAMLTAVTTAVSSGMQYLRDVEEYQNGSWHGTFLNLNSDDALQLKSDSQVKATSTIQNIGFAYLEGSQNEYKPYVYIGGVKAGGTGLLPIHITEGKLPTNESEVLVPEHVASNGRVKYSMGQTLTLTIGSRVSEDGETLWNNTALSYHIMDGQNVEDIITEKLIPRETRTFTVVGFYERPSFEEHEAPGYTLLTAYDKDAGNTSENVYFTMKNAKDIFHFADPYKYHNDSQTEVKYNTGYLRAIGVLKDNNFKTMLYGFAAILIAIVIFGSVALIYNSFSISVNERIKQFGLLSSVGATKKQLMRSILFEASALCVIGLPIGVLSGIGGIWVTFYCIRDQLRLVFGEIGNLRLSCHVSWISLLIAVLLGFITVMISAYRPARRALKMSVIDAIRQTNEIKIKPGKVKTSKLTYKLFAFEGMVASKNFKRNKKRYRATVISLFVSIVLFISTSSFCEYFKDTTMVYSNNVDYDISYSLVPDKNLDSTASEKKMQTIFSGLAGVPGVTASSYSKSLNTQRFLIPLKDLNREFVAFQKEQGRMETISTAEGDFAVIQVSMFFIDDNTFRTYCNEIGVDAEFYLTTAETSPAAIAVGTFVGYNYNTNKRFTSEIFEKNTSECRLATPALPEGAEYLMIANDVEDQKPYCYYIANPNAENSETNKMQFDVFKDSVPLSVGAKSSETPYSLPNTNDGMMLLYPYRAAEKMFELAQKTTNSSYWNFAFQAKNHTAVHETMAQYLEENGESASRLNDYAESMQSQKAYVSVVSIFSYGFIVLISLIAIANVFNTISTNIQLRRREFAMLKSIGMTQRGFRKMMNYECILYGLKGILYGLPVAFFVTYLIFRVTNSAVELSFYVPWYSVAIAIGSVFFVVFATMLYTMRQIRKDNPIDALRNENL